jgi:hypothetical protein
MKTFKHIILAVHICAHCKLTLGNIHLQKHLIHTIFIHYNLATCIYIVICFFQVEILLNRKCT